MRKLKAGEKCTPYRYMFFPCRQIQELKQRRDSTLKKLSILLKCTFSVESKQILGQIIYSCSY